MKKFETLGLEGQLTVESSEIYSKRLIVVQKDGVGLSKILFSGVPVIKEVLYLSGYGLGSVTFSTPLVDGEPVLVLYVDADLSCEPPLVQVGSSLPYGIVGVDYSASFVVNGQQPFTLSGITLPDGLVVNVSGAFINFTGIPTTTGFQPVALTITNECGSVDFSQDVEIKDKKINWTYSNAVGLGGTFRIIINSILVVSTTASGSGSLVVNIDDNITIVVQSTLSGTALIDISGPYNNSSVADHINSDGFIVVPGIYFVGGSSN